MTAHRSVLIACDGENCDEFYPDSTFEPGTASYHRETLRELGWRTGLPGGRDLCPACQEAS